MAESPWKDIFSEFRDLTCPVDRRPMLSGPRFYWGACFVCMKKSSLASPLKKCSRCRCVYYCSKEHQKMHWKNHKELCNHLTRFPILSSEPVTTEIWAQIRMEAVSRCETLLMRPLQIYETELFLFPRVCRVCHISKDKMFDCESCYCLSYCSEQHREEDKKRHIGVGCRQLTLTMAADIYETVIDVGVPGFPDNVDSTYLGTEPSILHFFHHNKPPPGPGDEIREYELEVSFLTCQLSGSLTLLDSIDRYSRSLAQQPLLIVHVAGANHLEELAVIKWEYLIHRLPSVKKIVFCFIGPTLKEDKKDSAKVPNCDHCVNQGRVVEYRTFPCRYEQFLECSDENEAASLYKSPDLVLVQNCGFSEYEDTDDEEGWTNGWENLNQLLPERENSLLVFTSYTLGEAERDLERFLKYSDTAEVLAAKQENPMRSHRPVRDFEMAEDRDVFFCNGYLSVVRRNPLLRAEKARPVKKEKRTQCSTLYFAPKNILIPPSLD